MQDENQKPQEINPYPVPEPQQGWDPFKTNNDSQPYVPTQVTPAPVPQPLVPESPMPALDRASSGNPPSHTKRNVLIVLFTLLSILGAAALYVFYVYLPNKPEIVLQKAVESYINDNGNYSIAGKLDQAGPNDPDFSYTMKTNTDGDAETNLSIATFLQNPRISTISADKKLFLKFNGFQDFKTLSKSYRNVGQPGIQEAIAFFTETSGIADKQDNWLEVGSYVTDQPMVEKKSPERIPGIPGARLKAIGPELTLDKKSVRKYEITLDGEAFKLMLGHVDSRTGVPILSGITANREFTSQELPLNLWVNLDTKKIHQIEYSGRPYTDTTFDIKITANNGGRIITPGAGLLTAHLNYGIVNKMVFNKDLQLGGTDADKQRVADLKGIKTALEIYKGKKGHYPERYEMSVNQESFLNSQMPGADHDVFKDPSNAFIGRNGSQYTYAPFNAAGQNDCGKFSQPCKSYFIVTTLDNGQKYQLNSD